MSLRGVGCSKSAAKQKGFTLLEVLVSILVLSFGMLGLAAMQLNALQSAHFSYQSTIANLVAKDAKERLWAQLLNLNGLEYVTCPTRALVDEEDEESEDEDGRLAAVQDAVLLAWTGKLPGMSVDLAEESVCNYLVEVSWRDERLDDEDEVLSLFDYYVRLPGFEFPN
jgi:type IV pilus assembly protein PilV